MISCAVEHLNFATYATTDLRWDGRFYFIFFCSSSENVTVKKLLKSVNVWPRYCQHKRGAFLRMAQCCRQFTPLRALWLLIFWPDSGIHKIWFADCIYFSHIAGYTTNFMNGVWIRISAKKLLQVTSGDPQATLTRLTWIVLYVWPRNIVRIALAARLSVRPS